ncbi:NCS cytosine-purine permease [Schizopora paradoxa]|uniref:NCS cytosine-purine permease n=1 Tax=Schizopora paradoxa TaxID=27342 RepID=A0A0H2RIG6_9AGAM|nr:NCS cytosine-purine permease [Schizopora paradoxa]
MSKDVEELKYADGKGEDVGGPEIIDVEANSNERSNGLIYSSKEQDWVDQHANGFIGRIANFLVSWGVESRGIFPVPPEQRVDKQFHKIFFIWFSANFNILSFSAGTVGPSVYGLSLNDSCLIILFFNLLCSIPPAYLTTWGPKLGLRQMCQARYSFGYYGVIILSVINLATMTGFMILNCILGGQTLASVTNGSLSWSVGIVIIAVVSLLVSFCGYKVLTWYERIAWIPTFIVYLVALGVGGKHLSNPPAAEPATAVTVLSYASVLAGFVITYSPLSSDFTTYMDPNVSSWKMFIYSYLGFLLPIVPIQCIGAVFAVATPLVPSWSEAFASGSPGGLLQSVLSPTGGFGNFLTVLLSLSVTANIAPTMYSFGLSFQVFAPFCTRVPRYVFSLLSTAIVIPLSIVGAHRFYTTLTNFLGLIGYWASCFIAVIVTEHFVFRRHAARLVPSPPSPGRVFSKDAFENYDLSAWNSPSRLPSGIPAIAASVLSFGLVVPSMDQVWFVGPIAKTTGDIGFEMALVLTAIFYVPLRYLEVKIQKTL